MPFLQQHRFLITNNERFLANVFFSRRAASEPKRVGASGAESRVSNVESFTDRREKDLYLEYRRHYDASVRRDVDKNLGDRWADRAFRD